MSSTEIDSPAMSGGQLICAVGELRHGAATICDALADGVLSDVAEQCVPQMALDLLAAADRLTAAASTVIGRVHTSGVLREQGVVSTKQWLIGKLGSAQEMRLARSGRSVTCTALTWHQPPKPS